MLSSEIEDQSISSPPTRSRECCASKNIFRGFNKAFHEVKIIRQINKAKFPVYLARSQVSNLTYAMKAFPYQNDQPHPYYKNEIRFSNLYHPNVIKNLYYEQERKTKTDRGTTSVISYKIMEYAPYGDMYDFVTRNSHFIDEKFARTYFKQLIQGLEYLHQMGISHLDIKLENLLIGENYVLKIGDFDLSYFANDSKVISKGTKFYRAPELKESRCKNTKAADVYSAGIVLFALKTQGILPHAENNLINGIDFSQLLHNNDPSFWQEHCNIQSRDESFFDEDFKRLFLSMTWPDPEKRATITDIKKSKWYNGPCYTPEELQNKMSQICRH